MTTIATINVRMPEELKSAGTRVLERNHVSPSDLVRSVYKYMEEKQEIPKCLDVNQEEELSIYEQRRKLLRELVTDWLPKAPEGNYDKTFKELRHQRIEERYSEYL